MTNDVGMMTEAAASSSSSVPPNNKPKRFTLTKWDAVALWKWNDVAGTVCTICKEIMAKPCNVCQDSGRVDCRIVHGVCNHVYHEHCIINYLARTNLSYCPHCSYTGQIRDWRLSRHGL